MKVFFGKFAADHDQFEEQIKEKRYYSLQGSTWFNGISEGDYCFILAGRDVYLWKASKYEQEYLQFEAVISDKLPMDGNKFKAFKYLQFNPQNIVLSTRQVRGKAFFEIQCFGNFTESILTNIETYKEEDNYRKIYIVDKQYSVNDKDIYLIKENNGYSLYKSPFIEENTYNSFKDNTVQHGKSGKERSNKDSTIKKVMGATINTLLQDVSLLSFYDLFFSEYRKVELLDDERGDDIQDRPIKGCDYPLNQILYGPPGTGKTYNTVNKAVDICRTDNDNFPSCGDHKSEGHQTKCNECAKEAYKLLKKKGRIEFVTFHQSYGYEEFIEGIRAETIENSDGTSSISYDVQPGVFKRISQLAGKNSGTQKSGIKEFTDVFKDAVIDKVSKDEKLEITMTRSRYFINEVTERTIFFDKDKGESKHSLSIKTLQKIYDAGSNQIIVGGLQPYYEALLQYLNECSQVTVQEEKKNYVLIIDEINRGNMSKIFGELITLIEDDKRLGKPNEMTVRLPVSGDEFGVPSNLHIIGTMNTADRSIAMMDTALRRRFEFEEMMPNSCLLHKDIVDEEVDDWEDIDSWDFSNLDENWKWDEDWDGDILIPSVDASEMVNLRRMLYMINQRIEVLYDREHTIGHAYFMGLSSDSSIEDLGRVFANKVIPLLAEYFFEDWDKIRMVLGDNQKKETKHQFVIEKRSVKYRDLFGSKGDGVFDDERKVYERNVQALEQAESYIGIYTQLATDKVSKTQDSEASE